VKTGCRWTIFTGLPDFTGKSALLNNSEDAGHSVFVFLPFCMKASFPGVQENMKGI